MELHPFMLLKVWMFNELNGLFDSQTPKSNIYITLEIISIQRSCPT